VSAPARPPAWRAGGRAAPLLAALGSFAAILACLIAAGLLLRSAERAGGSTPFDASVTSWMVRHRTHALTTLARTLSTLGGQVVLAPLVAVAAVALAARQRLVLVGLLVVTWAGAGGLSTFTKLAVDRRRPPEALWLRHTSGASFPSGHATQSLATYAALAVLAAVLVPRARALAAALAVVLVLVAGIGWSRVYLGVHWTTDVLAGWVAAAVWAIAVVAIARRLSGDRSERCLGRTARTRSGSS
jgi:membrane-associated phospholipid phosphatase